MSSLIDRLRQSLGAEPTPQPEPTLLSQLQAELGDSSSLSRSQRFWAFTIAIGLTALFWGLGSLMLMTARLSSFILFFTLGNISSLAATCFIVGPMKQLKNMFTKERMAAGIAYSVSLVLTLWAAITFKGTIQVFVIVIPCLIVQLVALIWYCSTYIPGGQGFFMKMIGYQGFTESMA